MPLTLTSPHHRLLSPRLRDHRYNSPSIITWTVFNEKDCVAQFNATRAVELVQELDPSRLVDTDSGGPANNLHIADANDVHVRRGREWVRRRDTVIARLGDTKLRAGCCCRC